MPQSLESRDHRFAQILLLNGLVDRATLDRASNQLSSRDTPNSATSLADLLVQSGALTEKARQAIETLLDEHRSRQAADPQASISSLTGFSTEFQSLAQPGGTITSTFAHQPAAEGDPPQRQFGDYELLGEIARGGMGVVYKARQIKLNRLVALKMIRSGELASPDDVRRFYAEAEAAARLDHPGIVPVYEVGQVAGQHFFSMAFVPGQSLNARVKADGPLAPTLAAQLLKSIATAVQYAHDKGIVHRDIKPHNVLLDEHDQPRVSDFGLAKHAQSGSDMTATGQVLGTPSYMPPEQAQGRTDVIGPAADVYSLGATLYCLLVGRPPFQASSSAETIRQVIDNQPVPLRRLNVEIPRDLETICLKCLRKEPDKRYASARDLADDLSRFLAGEPIAARPVGAVERGAKWVQRKPVAAALAAVSLLAAGAVIAAGVSLGYQRTLSRFNDNLATKNRELDEAQKTTAAARDEANNQRDAANEAKKTLAQHRYAADLTVAGRAWREGDVGRMLTLLDRQVPQAGDEDPRGFEWYYLRGLERHELWRGANRYTLLSPHGKYLAVAQENGVRLLDPHTRELIREFPGLSPTSGAFAFSRDSRRMIVPVSDTEVVVWDVEQGTEVNRLQGDDLYVTSAFINADGTQAATSGQGDDHALRLWDVATGRQTKRWDFGGYPTLAAFSPDGKQLAFASTNSTIQVHNLAEDKPAYTTPSLRDFFSALTYDPTGQWLIGATGEDAIYFFEAASGQPVFPPARSGGLLGVSIDFTPDGKYILTGVARDNTVRLWDAATGRQLCERRGHSQKIARVSLHPDGNLALSLSYDGTARLWDMRGTQDVQEITGPSTSMWKLQFSPAPNTSLLAVLDENSQLYFWDGARFRPLVEQGDRIWQYAFSPDGKTILAAGYAGAAAFWDVATGLRLHPLDVPASGVFEVAYSPSGKYAATVGVDHTIRIWDPATGRQLHQIAAPTTNNGMVKLYFRPGSDLLVSAQSFEGLQLIQLGDEPKVETIKDKVMTYHLEFGPQGDRVVTGGMGALSATVWSFPQLEQLFHLQGHRGTVSNFHFSPDRRRLATLSSEKTIKLWDLQSAQELLTLPCGEATDFAFSPDGRRLAATSGNTILIWDTARGHADR